MKTTITNNNFNKLLKNSKKKRIKEVTYYKHCATNTENKNIKSILMKNDKYKNPFRKKKVTFNDNVNIKTYNLSNEEKMDKLLYYQMIKNKRKYYW